MRSRPLALGTVCAVIAAVELVAPGAAQAATVVHVRQIVGCSDSAPDAGSDAVPYCTVSAAVAAAQPGQEISVGDGTYDESVTVTRSGTPEAPITIAAEPGATVTLNGFFDGSNPQAHPGPVGLTLQDVHDVVVRGISLMGFAQDAVLVTGSSDVVLDGLNAQNTVGPAVEITGNSSNDTLSRSRLISSGLYATVDVNGGAHDVTVTTNDIDGGNRSVAGIIANGAVRTIVTSNTVSSVTKFGIALERGAEASTVENNVLIPDRTAIPGVGSPMLDVDSTSVSFTKADYNVIQAGANFAAYSWGDAYNGDDQADFAAVSNGQGVHDVIEEGDLDSGPWLSDRALEHDPRIDSADTTAPGELATDIDGTTAVDDPLVANSGAASGYRDRGASEFLDPLAIQGGGFEPLSAPIGTPVTITVTPTGMWSPHLTYTFAFDDGSPTVSGSSDTIQHVFKQAGRRKITVTVTDDLGGKAGPTDMYFSAAVPGPLKPVLTLRSEGPGMIMADEFQSTDPWPVTKATFTLGDGSPSVPFTGYPLQASVIHKYKKPGTYTVTLTLTDYIGRTASTSQKVKVDLPGGGTPPPPPVSGSIGPKVYRDAGADRVATGIAISQQRWAARGSAKAVVLATSLNYPDALSGGPLATKKGGPLLLTDGAATQLDPRILTEIRRVLPTGGAVYVLGGDSAMNPAIVGQLERLGYTVTQYKGTDRADTALRVARDGMGSPNHVVLATGAGFADALAAGPYAAGPFADSPGAPAAIVLSDGSHLSPATAAFLKGKTVATVGAQAGRAWPGAVKSFSGVDRFDTAARVAREFTGAFAKTQVGVANGVASGSNPGYPDALTGGTFMAESMGPIVLVDGISGTIPAASRAALADRADDTRADIFGGTSIISPSLAAAVVALLHGTAQF